jgi:hypothetical protein
LINWRTSSRRRFGTRLPLRSSSNELSDLYYQRIDGKRDGNSSTSRYSMPAIAGNV